MPYVITCSPSVHASAPCFCLKLTASRQNIDLCSVCVGLLSDTSGSAWELLRDTVTRFEAVRVSHAPEGLWKHLSVHTLCTSKCVCVCVFSACVPTGHRGETPTPNKIRDSLTWLNSIPQSFDSFAISWHRTFKYT